ncbi:hypothetical protein FRC09_008131, partial [Ceratobasidium sp. 395]
MGRSTVADAFATSFGGGFDFSRSGALKLVLRNCLVLSLSILTVASAVATLPLKNTLEKSCNLTRTTSFVAHLFVISPLKDAVKRHVATYFRANNSGCTFHQWFSYIPDRCKRWGKVRIGVDGDDCIRSTLAAKSLSVSGEAGQHVCL